MTNSKKVVKTIRMRAETSERFDTAFEESNVDSKGEFVESLLNKELIEKPTIKIEEVKIEVEKKLEPNQILISLTPAQKFALRGHVLGSFNFAEKQNKIIDKLGNKPWWASNDAYKPEFRELWVRNIELTEIIDETEREGAIKHNMSAYLINMFLIHLIDGDITESEVSVENIESFIREQGEEDKSLVTSNFDQDIKEIKNIE